MKFRFLLLICALLALAGCYPVKGRAACEKAVDRFHEDYVAARIEQINAAAHPDFQAAHMGETLKVFREQQGGIVRTRLSGWNVEETSAGQNILMFYSTLFEKSGGHEEFTYRLKDGQPVLVAWKFVYDEGVKPDKESEDD